MSLHRSKAIGSVWKDAFKPVALYHGTLQALSSCPTNVKSISKKSVQQKVQLALSKHRVAFL